MDPRLLWFAAGIFIGLLAGANWRPSNAKSSRSKASASRNQADTTAASAISQ